MSARTQKTIPVNAPALKAELFKRGLTCSDVAREMGRSPKYFSNKLVGEIGYINATDVKFLKALYNINAGDYEVKEEEPKEEEPDRLIIDAERLEEIIYNAVKRALAE